MRSFVGELRRRNVLRAGALYAAGVWALAQGIAQLGPSFGLPDWGTRWFVIAAIIGFPFWIAFAWFYEFTPEGLKRESEVEPARVDHAPHGPQARLRDHRRVGGRRRAADDRPFRAASRRQRGSGDSDRGALDRGAAVREHERRARIEEYFSDGISEELLNLLAKIPQLQVTARTSSFSFKGKELAIPEIARTLHVANVLEGSVRKSGNSVRITAQLINAATDTHLWSQTYDRKLDDIFAIQDEIAADVVKQLKVTLLGAAPKARTTDPEAYALYLQAVQLGRQGTAEAFKASDALYGKVLAIDPRYAPAWAALAENFYREAGIGLITEKEGYGQAREAATKALAIDPDYAPAHTQLGYIAEGDNDLAGAAQHLERALVLDPADLDVLRVSATLLESLGRLDEALALDEALVRRDPVNVNALFNLGLYQRQAGRLDAAIASFRTALSLSPGRANAHAEIGNALLLKGDAQGALAEIERETSEIWKTIGLPMAYYAVGRKADSDTALAALIAKSERDAPSNIASVYAYRGEADQAFEWLDKAIEYSDPGLADIVTENLFDTIHADPRWLLFLRKIGKAPEQLAKIEFKVTLPQDVVAQSVDAHTNR